ncbi:MAG: hypothetical protein EA379_01330 [Phycisphaerales bacterium]|nr:MAG: hypothetical protein EA379_01330 [Phycisphaerales bacterium]
MSFTGLFSSLNGSKSLGFFARDFLGSRWMFAIRHISQLCRRDSDFSRPSAIATSSRSVNGPGSTPATPAHS